MCFVNFEDKYLKIGLIRARSSISEMMLFKKKKINKLPSVSCILIYRYPPRISSKIRADKRHNFEITCILILNAFMSTFSTTTKKNCDSNNILTNYQRTIFIVVKIGVFENIFYINGIGFRYD